MWGELALEAQAEYFELLATVGEVRRADGVLAVCTGVFSNTENGVVANSADEETIVELRDWFEVRGAPASWIALEPAEELLDLLVRAGCRPDRSHVVMGARLETLELSEPQSTVEIVSDEDALDDWLSIGEPCGVISEPGDVEAVRRVALGIGMGGDGPLVRYLARRQGRPVGVAEAFYGRHTASLQHVGVLDAERRRGIGRALAVARLLDARRRGYETAVLGPSAEGQLLYESLGFTLEPGPPDRWFYLPVNPAGP